MLGSLRLEDLGLGLAVADRNLARLFRLGKLAHELHVQETVFELCAGDLDVIRKLEAALEGTGRDALIEHLTLGLVALLLLLAADRERVFLGFDRQIALGEARNRDRDAIGVIAGPLDVVGRVGRGLLEAGAIEHREQTVEADGGTIKGSKIESSHGISSLKRHAGGPPRGPDRDVRSRTACAELMWERAFRPSRGLGAAHWGLDSPAIRPRITGSPCN